MGHAGNLSDHMWFMLDSHENKSVLECRRRMSLRVRNSAFSHNHLIRTASPAQANCVHSVEPQARLVLAATPSVPSPPTLAAEHTSRVYDHLSFLSVFNFTLTKNRFQLNYKTNEFYCGMGDDVAPPTSGACCPIS